MIAFMLRINEADLDSMLEESSLLEGRFYGEEEEEDRRRGEGDEGGRRGRGQLASVQS